MMASAYSLTTGGIIEIAVDQVKDIASSAGFIGISSAVQPDITNDGPRVAQGQLRPKRCWLRSPRGRSRSTKRMASSICWPPLNFTQLLCRGSASCNLHQDHYTLSIVQCSRSSISISSPSGAFEIDSCCDHVTVHPRRTFTSGCITFSRSGSTL